MGYTTGFEGRFELDRPLTKEDAAYLREFSETRRMKRNPDVAAKMADRCRVRVGLPIGVEAGYFTGGVGDYGQGNDPSVVEHNVPPKGQPSLWCQWTPSEDLKGIEWNGGEKFYSYVEWLQYIIGHFLKRWGYVLNGEVRWQGEDDEDCGIIVCRDNVVMTAE